MSCLSSFPPSQTLNWLLRGIFYGYPSCCIKEFLETGIGEFRAKAPHYGTGFLCCKACDSKTPESLTSEISTQRFADSAFPDAHDDEDEYVAWMRSYEFQHGIKLDPSRSLLSGISVELYTNYYESLYRHGWARNL